MGDIKGRKVTENIYYCPDGKYRWIYELNILKNPVILITIWELFGGVILVQIIFSLILEAIDGNISSWFNEYVLSPGVITAPAILFGFSFIVFAVYGCVCGWKFIVLYEMDDNGVNHIQMPRHFDRSMALSWVTAMAGVGDSSFSTSGAGILAASKFVSTSNFEYVKTVIRKKGLHFIKVAEIFEKNRVFVDEADFEFVWEFITRQCPKARIRK